MIKQYEVISVFTIEHTDHNYIFASDEAQAKEIGEALFKSAHKGKKMSFVKCVTKEIKE